MAADGADGFSLSGLRHCGLQELEALYAAEGPIALPRGCFRGVHLAWLKAAGAPGRVIRPLQWLGFRLVPFGVDFTAGHWFFFHPGLGIGRFVAQVGRSRWRDTETIRLHYHVSRLPRPLRAWLYDEVKPLSPSLCLGIGGIDAPRGQGDHFFFALANAAADVR